MGRRGFTLVELLISMVITLMILAALAIVFKGATDTTNIGEARIRVYDQVRKAHDRLMQDLLGAVNFDTGYQAFVLQNGYSTSPGAAPTYGYLGNWESHVKKGADRIMFRTVSSAGDVTQQIQVTYELVPYNDPTRRGTRSGRPLFVLMRRMRAPNPGAPKNYDQPVKDSTGTVLEDEELVHFVTSLNVEYYADNGRFSQLEPSPCEPTDPLGDGQGTNDTGNTAIKIPAIRVTITVVDDVGERQERSFSRVLWLPVGN